MQYQGICALGADKLVIGQTPASNRGISQMMYVLSVEESVIGLVNALAQMIILIIDY